MMNRFTIGVFFPVLLAVGCENPEAETDAEARRWLEFEIERPAAAAAEEPEVVGEESFAESEDGLITRTYQVFPSFLSSASMPEDSPASSAPDPFAPSVPVWEPVRLLPPRAVLEAYGVEFGPGATAYFSREKSTLRVTQTPEQIDRVEAIVYSMIGQGPEDWSSITIRFEIYELPTREAAELERSAAEHYEHTPEWNAVLERVKDGGAEIVTTVNLPARSGMRSRYEDGFSRPVSGNLTAARADRNADGGGDADDDGGERPSAKRFIPVRGFGTRIDVDPVIGPDGRTLDLTFRIDHHIAVAGSDPGKVRYLRRSMEAIETVLSGTVKLLGSWPASDPDGNAESARSRIVFLEATTVADLTRDNE